MKAEQMQEGLVVKDLEMSGDRNHFRVVETVDATIGPWTIESVAGRRSRRINLVDLEKFEPSPTQGWEGLIGRFVKLHMRFGTTLSGLVEAINYCTPQVQTEVWRVPKELVILGEVFDVKEVERVEFL